MDQRIQDARDAYEGFTERLVIAESLFAVVRSGPKNTVISNSKQSVNHAIRECDHVVKKLLEMWEAWRDVCPLLPRNTGPIVFANRNTLCHTRRYEYHMNETSEIEMSYKNHRYRTIPIIHELDAFAVFLSAPSRDVKRMAQHTMTLLKYDFGLFPWTDAHVALLSTGGDAMPFIEYAVQLSTSIHMIPSSVARQCAEQIVSLAVNALFTYMHLMCRLKTMCEHLLFSQRTTPHIAE